MTLQRQVMFWVGAGMAFAIALYILSDILLPFVAGLAIAYFLDPVADRLEKTGLPRLAAVSLIVLLFAIVVVGFILLAVPVLARQIVSFAGSLPGYVDGLASLARENGPEWLKKLLDASSAGETVSASGVAAKGAEWAGSLLTKVWSGGKAFVSLLSLLLVTPIVTFYMLNDWDRMVAMVDGWLPRRQAPTIRRLAGEIDKVMSGFVRGQVTVCLLLGIYYAVGLSLAGLNQGALIGLTAGALSFIPYVGMIVGLILSGGVAIVQFWPDYVQILIVLAIFAGGQFLEGNVLAPKLVGGKIGLHPVWLMFSLFAFGSLFGFVGLLIAVPSAAAIGVLTRFALGSYLASPLYLGARGRVPPEAKRKKASRAKEPRTPK